MSRDFLLILGGGVVSLVTTLVVLFITDLIYRRDQMRLSDQARHPTHPSRPESLTAASVAEDKH